MDMTDKRTQLLLLLSPDTDTDEVLDAVLALAETEVLNRMYPFGYPVDTVVPPRYEMLQVQLAAEIYTKRGADGQVSHSENGVSRSWAEKSALLSRIVPHVGGVSGDA